MVRFANHGGFTAKIPQWTQLDLIVTHSVKNRIFITFYYSSRHNDLTLDVQAGSSLVGVAHLSLLQVLGKDSLDLSLHALVQGLGLGQHPSVLCGWKNGIRSLS